MILSFDTIRLQIVGFPTIIVLVYLWSLLMVTGMMQCQYDYFKFAYPFAEDLWDQDEWFLLVSLK